MATETPSLSSHTSPLLVVDPDRSKVVKASGTFYQRFDIDEKKVNGVDWNRCFPSETMAELENFADEDTVPLLTVEDTEFLLQDNGQQTESVRLNAFRWEQDDSTPYLLIQLDPHHSKEQQSEEESEKLRFFNHLLYHFPDTIYFKDRKSRFLMINNKQAEVLGVDNPGDAVGKTDFDFFPEEQAQKAYEDEQKIVETGESVVNKQERVKGADGVRYWVSTTKVPIKSQNGEVMGTMGITRDITTQKELEDENQRLLEQERMLREQIENSYEELQIEKNRFQGAFEEAAIGMAIVSLEGQFVRVNESLCKMLGYEEEELKELTFQEITHHDDLGKDMEQLRELKEGKIDSYTIEKRYYHKEGDLIWAILNVSIVRDKKGVPVHFVSQIQDITERKEYEQKMDQSLKEKQVLLEEIHHRVKNNLASVSGILELQTYNIEDNRVKNVLQDAQSRIYTMALVHEQLYQHDSLSNIVLGSFVEHLMETINNSLNTDDKSIEPHVDAEQVTLEVTKAVPCGLIINELVTNAYKHGFEGRQEGNIWVKIRKHDRTIRIDVCDDGIGLPDDFSLQNQDTLGVNLIKTLIAQLEADISFVSENGAQFQITFPL